MIVLFNDLQQNFHIDRRRAISVTFSGNDYLEKIGSK